MSDFSQRLKEFPTLQTPRLTLRQVAESDADAYFKQLTALPRVSSWTDSYEAQSLENCRRAITTCRNQFQRTRTIIPWAITDRQDDLLGFVKLFDIQNRAKGELGYWLGETHRGQRLMPEAIRAVVDFAFSELGMHRLYATTLSANHASQRVLEKTGFLREGVLREHGRLDGAWTDAVLFGLLKTDNAGQGEAAVERETNAALGGGKRDTHPRQRIIEDNGESCEHAFA